MIYHSAAIDLDSGLYERYQNIYIAGKPALRIPEIQKMYDDFEAMGHRITYKWAEAEAEVRKPYREHLGENLERAEKMLGAAATADVFVFIQDENLHGALEERGAFAYSAMLEPKGKKMYVVEDKLERQSIFDSFDFVEVVQDSEKIYRDLGKIAALARLNAVLNAIA